MKGLRLESLEKLPKFEETVQNLIVKFNINTWYLTLEDFWSNLDTIVSTIDSIAASHQGSGIQSFAEMTATD